MQKPSKSQAKKKKRIASAIQFFDEQYGKDVDRLAGWQALCADVGVPSLEDVFVNIIDLVKAKRAGNAIHRFDNLKELQDYSHHTRKKFPLDEAKEKKMLEGSLVKMSGPRRL
ncbi:hypothetical protein CLAFUW4_00595 [Fulvia fulva]|uniref:Uncharacterized protein n=1 Tax=Passalora fulva TaxID=5499 RepID=A0A9Q8L5E6_PASFU|nr:uncharacterized protein CLAFUR5_00594 [Fulvia fulva]KAK4635234.1 hypothetical protein CLAFUR4_00596 [Fulvia fulva]KAK4636775.1 hypothetical protein CLAFUR0_00597 [Fulvia fulva]UJO11167.1 hypothetical protein CLAFUR5_00594 [Fulvia fulva]WPV09136.1 hypothetical protein CLAFUW4_00595 [Fulvia fulva]WPV23318.1 hypothetical protein CLAFUW7_00600 [Fulvia fulva]